MIIYGRNPVREALRAGRRRVRTVWATRAAIDGEPWLSQAGAQPLEGGEIERKAGSADHGGVCAECEPYPYVEPEALLTGGSLLVALDELQDPQNVGAICRTAECAGAGGVILCARRAVGVTPAVCKASAGAVEHLRIAQAGNLVRFLEQAKAAGRWCYGADASGSLNYVEADLREGTVLVLGAEGRGLRRLVRERCDGVLSLPLEGRVESLNASAAAAVLMYEALRQQKVS